MKRLNELPGSGWAKLTKSIWINSSLLNQIRKNPICSESVALLKTKIKGNQAMPYRAMDESRLKLIELFTQEGQMVLDPRLQDGETLLAALSLNRQFIGVAKTKEQCDFIKEKFNYYIKSDNATLFYPTDLNNALTNIKKESIDFVLSELQPFNFTNIEKYEENYLSSFFKDGEQYYRTLKPKSYIAIIVGDQRYKDRYYLRHAEVANQLQRIGFKLSGLITLIQENKALTTYGYPTTYVPNIVNQFIVIARKPFID